ncbi:MAG: hypothetical protein V1753_03665 [Pseudomonadota bacterium]
MSVWIHRAFLVSLLIGTCLMKTGLCEENNDHADLLKRLNHLEERIQQLEQEGSGVDSEQNGLKREDVGGGTLGITDPTDLSGMMNKLTPKQQEEYQKILKMLEQVKTQTEERNRLLEKLQ